MILEGHQNGSYMHASYLKENRQSTANDVNEYRVKSHQGYEKWNGTGNSKLASGTLFLNFVLEGHRLQINPYKPLYLLPETPPAYHALSLPRMFLSLLSWCTGLSAVPRCIPPRFEISLIFSSSKCC
jgi:hypothetical protein